VTKSSRRKSGAPASPEPRASTSAPPRTSGSASSGAPAATSSTTSSSSAAGAGSRSPSGGSRAGRRDRSRPAPRRSFLERHRTLIFGGVIAAGIAVVAFVLFMTAASPTYACDSQFQVPASALADPDGVVQDDMGRLHIQPGQFQRYASCPPASGNHINLTGEGPIQARFYGPNDAVAPQGWIHNLEHGGLVLLYKCGDGGTGCDATTQAAMKAFQASFPNSPICNRPKGEIGPVIARFEQMPHSFAALLWGRVLYLDSFDAQKVLTFFEAEAERANPEPQCNLNMSPAPALSPAPSPS
jgi:hypothetical protein